MQFRFHELAINNFSHLFNSASWLFFNETKISTLIRLRCFLANDHLYPHELCFCCFLLCILTDGLALGCKWRQSLAHFVNFQMYGGHPRCPKIPLTNVPQISKVIRTLYNFLGLLKGCLGAFALLVLVANGQLGFFHVAGELSSSSEGPDELFVRPESNFLSLCCHPPLSS